MVGVLLVIYRPGASGDALGVALTVAAVEACAFYAVLTRRLLLDDSSLAVVLVQQVAALCFAIVVAGVASAMGAADLGLPDDLATWALAAASGMVYYGFAFWFFVGGLRGVPASVAGSFLPLIPVFGLAAGYLLGRPSHRPPVGRRCPGHCGRWSGSDLAALPSLGGGWRTSDLRHAAAPVKRADARRDARCWSPSTCHDPDSGEGVPLRGDSGSVWARDRTDS